MKDFPKKITKNQFTKYKHNKENKHATLRKK